MKLEYTIGCTTFAKCLASLFQKNPTMKEDNCDTENIEEIVVVSGLPSPESVLVRSLALLGNYDNQQRLSSVLQFLKSYCTNINKHLAPLWNEKISELSVSLATKDEGLFYAYLFQFIIFTIKDIDDPKFAETLANKITDQVSLYLPVNQQQYELKVPRLTKECGVLFSILGLILCYVTDEPTVDTKLNLIIEIAKQVKGDDITDNLLVRDAAKGMGLASKVHFDLVKSKLEQITAVDALKKSNSIFSTLNFMKDTTKDEEIVKLRIFVIESWGFVIENAASEKLLKNSENKIFDYLCRHLNETKDLFLKRIILKTLQNIVQLHLTAPDVEFKQKHELLDIILKIPLDGNSENLSLFPSILKLATCLIRIQDIEELEGDRVSDLLQILCFRFFVAAQMLKTKFETQAEDEKISLVAKYVNLSLPELNAFIRVSIELQPTPHRLETINDTLEVYLKDKNSEVRICSCHITNAALDVYMKTVKIGCEAPSKFTQTGAMLGRVVPR